MPSLLLTPPPLLNLWSINPPIGSLAATFQVTASPIPDYEYLREDIEQFRTKLNDKRVSRTRPSACREKKEKKKLL
jgi:hypothetical protein